MSNTSFLDYLMLLKQVKNVPPEVKAVAINDIDKIKKTRIHIPDATIRNSFNRGDQETQRDYVIKDEDDYSTGPGVNWELNYSNQAQKFFEDTKKDEKQWSTQGTVGSYAPPFKPSGPEEVFI